MSNPRTMRDEKRYINMYCIYDKRAYDFGPIFEAVNDSVAVRQYTQVMKDNPYTEDYRLMYVGQIIRGNHHIEVIGCDPEEVPMNSDVMYSPEQLIV